MAKKPTRSEGAWGIDIGQFALKALRCTKVDGEIVADDFEYIEYSKILSQPEADRNQLIEEAISTFLERNDTTGDKIAITVPGQDGLTKFFKPPPSDIKKLPSIVEYEAQQQIPFDLAEVVWTYQKMSGSQQDGNLLGDAEVGLFAIKRDQLERSLNQFEAHDLDLHGVQMAPLSIYNFVAYDLLEAEPDPDDYDPDDPPASYVVISIGTETTDMVITNGHRVWPRSLPIGGNHFTRSLTRELKLTFAKAEHLKRNASDIEDQKKVILAMRAVFQDMVTEIKRSIDYFNSIDRRAKIQGIVLLGNTVKLPGLRRFLASNLGYDIIAYDSFKRLQGSSVTSNPIFRDNFLSFGPCYGLCLQTLEMAQVDTDLLPREIITERLVEAKRPWVIASISALLLGCAFNYFFAYGAWLEVNKELRTEWAGPMSAANNAHVQSSGHLEQDDKLKKELSHLTAVGDELVGNNERRLMWLELFRALNSALPRAPDFQPGIWRDPNDKNHTFDSRVDLYIKTLESKYFEDLVEWFTPQMQQQYRFTQPWLFEKSEPEKADGNGIAGAGVDNGMQGSGEGTSTTTSGPSGPGWVIELTGFHYFSKSERDGGVEHVRNTIIKNLSDKIVMLPDADGDPRPFTMDELGIGYAVLLDLGETKNEKIINPNADPATAEGGEGEEGAGAALAGAGDQGQAGLAGDANSFFTVKKYSFTLQFSWQAPLVTERLTRRNEFVTAWENASSLEQVGTSPNIGMTVEQVKRRAERYRTMNDLGLANITLKDFDQPEPPNGAGEAPIDAPPGGP